ncbi:polyprenyl synthetase family protein [Amorphus orientalis]|uniref:Geranylgeranyl diphosphate synthase type II n=1 Tax=Amorphus orientalis TaxID=649198 RepID=A0AAE3VNQ6_9HYPH|nr:polyprenyl synthetase family protein [Amorphus orientalis]MDQ0315484.1 geranylgeranyl diphosphate synthase type II [Amorphus orientalis]
MDPTSRIELALEAALGHAATPGCPPKLARALHYAVFPGGARVRPRLCLSVAHACAEEDPTLPDAAATAIEFLHCASLVHDDLPCFDDAALRRGKPSVHVAFGEPLAVLTGDALIVLAFETLARAAVAGPALSARLACLIGRAAGAPDGIAAGQAWESEEDVELAAYHRSKTGSLFATATMSGAASVGADPDAWRMLGERIGEAYQVADDLRDAVCDAATMGKPARQDAALDRPNAVSELGLEGAVKRLEGLIASAIASIPDCAGADDLRAQIGAEAKHFLPKGLARVAA